MNFFSFALVYVYLQFHRIFFFPLRLIDIYFFFYSNANHLYLQNETKYGIERL